VFGFGSCAHNVKILFLVEHFIGKKPMPLGRIPVVLVGYGRNRSELAAYLNKSNQFSNKFHEPKAKNDEKYYTKSGIAYFIARDNCHNQK
jgi:hypothetical protein